MSTSRRREVGLAPQLGGGVDRRHLRVVGALVPAARPAARRPSTPRAPVDSGSRPRSRRATPRPRSSRRSARRSRAARTDRRPAAREVVVHRDRLAVRGARVERGVAPAVDGEPAELLLRRAVEVHVALRVHGEPVRGGVRAVREQRRHVAHDAGHGRRPSVALGAAGRGGGGGCPAGAPPSAARSSRPSSARCGRRARAARRRRDGEERAHHRGEQPAGGDHRDRCVVPPNGSATSAAGVSPMVAMPSMSPGRSPRPRSRRRRLAS